MDLTDLTYTLDGPLCWITLARPAARNAYSQAMIDALISALDAAEDDDAVRCVILTGQGSCFSAGGDLKLMRDRQGMFAGDSVHLRSNYLRGIHRIPRRLARFDKPLIAAINGPAIGAGLDLACMCDLRVASTRAKLGSTFVKVGLIPGDGGAHLLARVVGLPRALDLILSGRVIDAPEALAINLVHQVVPHASLSDAARALASPIAANPPLAVRLAKRAAYRSWEMGLDDALELAATYQSIVQRSPEHDACVDALLSHTSKT